ncbi:MAG TPA: glycosyltransferase [Steroidobacteraceae bacterium]|nr:glycosyltransferase [Steroidobacteraceae bacterium]
MRALFVSDVYFPRVNGVSTSIATFRADLAECGVDTELVAPQYNALSSPEPGITRIASAAVPGDPEDRRMHWRALTRTLDALGNGRFDLVHIHTPFIAHYAGVRLARRAGIACLATYHTFFEEYLHHYVPALPHSLGRLLARAFTRSQCRSVHALVAPSEPMRTALLEYGVRVPIHIVPTGLPADRFRPGDGGRFRAFASLPPGRQLLLYVGRIAHEKNIEFLVRSYLRVRLSVPDAMLVIAGEGPAQPTLQQLVAELGLTQDVRFVGYLDRNETLLDCYAAADVFVFASRTETQGLVLLEAMAQGAPIVSTAELGTRSVLRPGCGALVVGEQIEEFALAVVRVLREPALRAELAMAGRAYAQNWSSPLMARRLADVYREVIAAHARRRLATVTGPCSHN